MLGSLPVNPPLLLSYTDVVRAPGWMDSPHYVSQVGWSTARDYYTFLWSPLPENYVEGTAVNRTVVFQGKIIP